MNHICSVQLCMGPSRVRRWHQLQSWLRHVLEEEVEDTLEDAEVFLDMLDSNLLSLSVALLSHYSDILSLDGVLRFLRSLLSSSSGEDQGLLPDGIVSCILNKMLRQ